jgi:hypothetical protein
VRDYSPAEFHNSVITLAKLGIIDKLPTVLATSLEDGPNGPLIPEVLNLFSGAADSSTWIHQRYVEL